jgi:transcriptional regulator with XRE-family HTH domain
MSDFGEKLRRQRESRNITLREISDSTKINKRYLEALERNDFDSLPGGVFTKGYIRTFAESIGMDPEPLLEDYRNELRARGGEDPSENEQAAKEAAQAALAQLASAVDRPRKARGILLPLLAGCAILAILIWAGFHYFSRQPAESRIVETPPPQISEPVAEPTPEPVVEATPAVVEPEPPAPEPAVVVPEPQPTAGVITIPDFGVGSGIANRQLVGQSDTFREGATVWFWTRVVGASPGDIIRHVWRREGVEAGVIELKIGGAHWRTQSRRILRQGSSGRWSVEARDAQGRLLARSEFNCLPDN